MKSHNVETLLLKRLLTHLQNGVIYLDLKLKACDTMDHAIQLGKLKSDFL